MQNLWRPYNDNLTTLRVDFNVSIWFYNFDSVLVQNSPNDFCCNKYSWILNPCKFSFWNVCGWNYLTLVVIVGHKIRKGSVREYRDQWFNTWLPQKVETSITIWYTNVSNKDSLVVTITVNCWAKVNQS